MRTYVKLFLYLLTDDIVVVILEYREKFWWFGHMWRHEQAHKFDEAYLEKSMQLNYQFAKVKWLFFLNNYFCCLKHFKCNLLLLTLVNFGFK